jgi:hypothetical protein
MGDEDNSIPWPCKGKTLLGPGTPWTMNACVGASRGDIVAYVSGFDQAARLLWESINGDGAGSPDVLVYPLVTLWRHTMELRLKQIVGYGTWIKTGRPRYPTGHDLRSLWSDAKPFVVELDEREQERAAIQAVQKAVHELHDVDPFCEGFRYPIAKVTGRPSLERAPSLVNLHEFNDVMTRTATLLDCAATEQRNRLDYAMEGWVEEARQAEEYERWEQER